MNRLKEIFTIAVTLVLLLQIQTFAESDPIFSSNMNAVVKSGNYNKQIDWTLYENGDLVISGNGDMGDYGYGSYSLFPLDECNKIIIEPGITSIGDYAFDTGSFTDVVIPDTVTVIERCAFLDSNLKELVIPDGVKTIEDSAFANNLSLKTVHIGKRVRKIEEQAFFRCESLVDLTFSEGIKRLGHAAFCGCDALEYVELPESIVYLGNAFTSCDNLSEVKLGNKLEKIDYSAFSFGGIKKLYIPASVKSISKDAFSESPSFTGLEVDPKNTVYSSSNGALYNKKKTVLYFIPPVEVFRVPDGVKTIEQSAAEYNSALTELYLGSDTKVLKLDVFCGCENLKKVVLGNKLTSLSHYTFSSCINLESLTIGKNIKRIDKDALYKCTHLKTVVIKSNKLTKKGVNKCFSKTKANNRVKIVLTGAAKKKYKQYKGYFSKKNCGVKTTVVKQ